MEEIKINFDGEYWTVNQGDKATGFLCWEEMMALITAITFPIVQDKVPFLQWMKKI